MKIMYCWCSSWCLLHYLLLLLSRSNTVSSSTFPFMFGLPYVMPEMQVVAPSSNQRELHSSKPEVATRQLAGFLFKEVAADQINETDFGDNQYEESDKARVQALTKSCKKMKPDNEEHLNVTFLLFTRRNPHFAYVIQPHISRHELFQNYPFDPRRSLKWVTHGYRTDIEKSDWLLEAKDIILSHEDSNVILTDWRRGASGLYPKAAGNAHSVAKMMVKLLHRLRYDLDFSQIHLIGHSLGAHIVGFVGRAFTEEYFYRQYQHQREFHLQSPPPTNSFRENQLIGRITACDPALPCFDPNESNPIVAPNNVHTELKNEDRITSTVWTHLSPECAVQVEVIHSNPGIMGYAEPLGDFDYYANGFELQPGCRKKKRDLSHISLIEDIAAVRGTGGGSAAIFPGLPFVGQFFGLQKGPVRQQALTGMFSRFQSSSIQDILIAHVCSHHRSVQYFLESMYYNQIVPQHRGGESDLKGKSVCQMIGYRCSDYGSFKRGFCFTCHNEGFDCRSFTMPSSSSSSKFPSDHPMTSPGRSDLIQQQMIMQQKWNILHNNTIQHSNKFHLYSTQIHTRYNYYFDTRFSENFCVHHYHLLIKFRWYENHGEYLSISGLKITGSLTSVLQQNEVSLYRYSHRMYTLLFTHSSFLGQIDSVLLFGDKSKTSLVEYVQLTYMSHINPKMRELGSAQFCLQDEPWTQQALHLFNAKASLFARCSGRLV